MQYLNGKGYAEVKDKRYTFQPTENRILGESKEPKNLRAQYEFKVEQRIRLNRIYQN